MRRFVPTLLVLAIALPLIPARADQPRHFRGYLPVASGTSDETLLHYQIRLPDPALWGPGPYPTVLYYDGYMTALSIFGRWQRWVENGYAVAGVNMRGTTCSGGTFDYFEPRHATDGYDVIEWLAQQPWSDGKIAMTGKSYPGISQLYVAATKPPSLRAIIPGHAFGDLYRDVPFPGGILNATFAGFWTVAQNYYTSLTGPIHYLESGDEQCLQNQSDHVVNPVMNPLVQILATNHFDGPLYWARSPWRTAHEIDVPVFLIGSWQDEQVGARSAHFVEHLRPDVPWRMLFTNGDHDEYYGPDVLPHQLRFLSYYLRGEAPSGEQLPEETFEEALARYEAEDPVVINWENGALGSRRSAWSSTYADWPPPETEVWRLHLSADGTLGDAPPPPQPLVTTLDAVSARAAGAVDYAYVPGIGTQARGGYTLVDPVPEADWRDRPPAGTAAAFETGPLEEDKVLLGSASVDLWLASTAPDTDLQVTLSEVRPDGQEMFVQQGWLRASRRLEDPRYSRALRPWQTHRVGDVAPLVPGQPALMRVEVFPFGHVFREGSRLRVSIEAPHTVPDLWGFAVLPTPAVNTIFTSALYPSSVALPLIAGAEAGASLPPCPLANQPCRSE